MKCPFYEEVIMAYCSACQKKKMIAKEQLITPNPCDADYDNCVIYQMFISKQERNMSKDEEKPATQAVPESKGQEKEKPCIWMKAGVIAYRMCTRNYDCRSCDFDQALLDQSGRYKETPLIVKAIEKMRQLPAAERKCRYMLTGDFSYKICPNNYECWHCPVDQYVQDTIDANPYLRKQRERAAKKERTVKGFKFRDDIFYLPNHTWIKTEGEAVKIGLDDFAIKLIGRINQINITEKATLPKGESCWNIGSKNRMVSMFLPFEADIIEVNNKVGSDPSLLETSPYNQAWLLKIRKPREMADLLKGAKAQEWLEAEYEKLHQEYTEGRDITVADGGEFVSSLVAQLNDEEWSSFIKRFLQ